MRKIGKIARKNSLDDAVLNAISNVQITSKQHNQLKKWIASFLKKNPNLDKTKELPVCGLNENIAREQLEGK